MIKKYLSVFAVLLMVFMIVPAAADETGYPYGNSDAITIKDTYNVTYIVWGDGYGAEVTDFSTFTNPLTGYYDFTYSTGGKTFNVAVIPIGMNETTWTLGNIVDEWSVHYDDFVGNSAYRTVPNETKVERMIAAQDVIYFNMMFSDEMLNTLNPNLKSILENNSNGGGKLWISVNSADFDPINWEPTGSWSQPYFQCRDEVMFTNPTYQTGAASVIATVNVNGFTEWSELAHYNLLNSFKYGYGL